MALWDSFLHTIEGVGKKVLSGFGVTGGVQQLGQSVLTAGTALGSQQMTQGTPGQAQLEEQLHQQVQDKLKENKAFDTSLTQNTGDLILKAGVALNDKVISPYVTRPIATVGLLSDTSSPLYKDGFQLNDIQRAYDRSEYVSPMQSFTKSTLIPLVGPLSSTILKTGGIDTKDVNLWSDASIKKNFSDNWVGRWFTGVGDFVVGNAALGAAGKVVGFGAKAAVEAAGLNTNKALIDFEKTVRDGFTYADTNGQQGAFNTVAAHMQELADTKDIAKITELTQKYSTNPELIRALHGVSTKEAALDIILADQGSLDAMVRLAETNPDHLFSIAKVDEQIQAQNLLKGQVFVPEGKAAERLYNAYETAIQKDARFDELRKVFLDDNYNPTIGGRIGYMPATPKYFAETLSKGGELARDIKSAIGYRDFDKLSEIAELTFAPAKGIPSTNFFKFVVNKATGLRPLGMVTNSGMRPLDAQVEVNAFLNNLDLFKDANKMIERSPGVYDSVANIRKEYEFNIINAKSDTELTQHLENMDYEIGRMLAYRSGFYQTKKIDALIADMRGSMKRQSDGIQTNGYAVNYDGSRMTTNAQTLRQMMESYQFTPWHHIEKQFLQYANTGLQVAGKVTARSIESLYEDLTKIWTFDVLARPMFIPKQSIAEPLVSVFLAQGVATARDAIRSLTGTALTAGRNRFMTDAIKSLNYGELKAVNEAVANIQQRLDKAIAVHDIYQTSYEELLSSPSNVLKEQHLVAAKADLDAARRAVENLEMEYHNAAVPYGQKTTVPSMANLERRLSWIENNYSGEQKARIAANIANAKAAISTYKGTISTLATNRQVLQAAEDGLKKAYQDIDDELALLSAARRNQADLWNRSAKYKKAYLGKTSDYRMVDGVYTNIDSFTRSETGANFARGIKAEISNSHTTDLNYLNELSVGARKALLERKVPNMPIDITNPQYFHELTHIANNLIRQEPLMDMILAGKSTEDLVRWGLTKQGSEYLSKFGVLSNDQIPAYMAEKKAWIERLFPSEEVRATLVKREMDPREMQQMLSNYTDRLFTINPTEFKYAENALLGRDWYNNIHSMINSVSSKVFKVLMSAENPIRDAYFNKVAIDKVAQKAEVLIKQGVDVTPNMWNALRQSAGREALQDLEKTIYTVHRQTRLLHTARVAVAFPTATLNAFYRYGRFAVNAPVRTAQFLNSYQSYFRSFGVDKNGNPTNDVNEIAYVVLPGSKEIPWLRHNGEGVQLNARSIGFMLNFASPSAISGIALGTLLKWQSGLEGPIKKTLGPLWDMWFPYGAPTSVGQTFSPPWLRNFLISLKSDKLDPNFASSLDSTNRYHQTLVDLGIEKEMPSEKQMREETAALFSQKARASFFSPYGVPYKVSTNKMDLMDTLWYTLMNKYKQKGMNQSEAMTAAGDEMLATLGPKFMVDTVSMRASSTRFNMPATPEAWDAIMKDNPDLVAKIASIKKGDIGLVGILTGDMKVDYQDRNMAIANKLKDPNLRLAQTSEPVNSLKKTPAEMEAIRQKNRVWHDYTVLRESLMKDIPAGKTLRDYPEKQAALEFMVKSEFKKRSDLWWNEYNDSQSGNTAWEYARAFNYALNDSKWMKSNANSQYWTDIKGLMDIRRTATMVYNAYDSGDPRKKQFLARYQSVIQQFATVAHPEIRNIITNYFDKDNLKEV